MSQQMSLKQFVRECVGLYVKNPILLAPPLLYLIYWSSLFLFKPLSSCPACAEISPESLAAGVAALCISLTISFVVLLGQASMTGKAVVGEKPKLADWWGARKYLVRVFGICVIYLGMIISFFALIGVLVAVAFYPEIFSAEATSQLPPIPHLEALGYAVAGVMALIQSIFYVLLAPVAVDDKGFGASIDAGFSAVKKCKQLFACFITLYLAVSLLTQLISSPQILLSSKEVRGFSACVEAQPYTVNLPRLVSKAVSTVFSPLWFLMAFVLYRESRAMDNSIGSGG